MADLYRFAADNEAFFASLKQAETIAVEEKQYALLPQIYVGFTRYYLSVRNFSETKKAVSNAMRYAQLSKSPAATAYAHYAKACYYTFFDIRKPAVENVQMAFDLLKKESCEQLTPYLYYTLYGAYSHWDNTELAGKYAAETVAAAQKSGNYDMLSNAFSAMSVVMGYRFKETKNENYKDSILYYLNKSVEVYALHPNLVSNKTGAIANVNIADYYFQYKKPEEKNVADSIRKYAATATRIIAEKDNDYLITGNVNGLLSVLATRQGHYAEAEQLLSETFIKASEPESPNYYMLSNLAQSLCDLYNQKKDYKKALYFKSKKEEFTQKIYDLQQIEQTLKLEAEYENKQIKQEVEIMKERVENKKMQNYLFLGITILLLTLLYFITRSYYNKTRLHREKEMHLKKEKEGIERNAKTQLLLEKEEQARLKAEQELLRLKNEQMQKEALADALQLERKNKLLDELKENFKPKNIAGATLNMEKIWKNEKRIEASVEKSVKEFQEIHPDFFRKLNENSQNKLSALDLKYCACIYLKLSTKDIATMYGVEPKSVRMSKYRIKQKLNLSSETGLEDFLQKL